MAASAEPVTNQIIKTLNKKYFLWCTLTLKAAFFKWECISSKIAYILVDVLKATEYIKSATEPFLLSTYSQVPNITLGMRSILWMIFFYSKETKGESIDHPLQTWPLDLKDTCYDHLPVYLFRISPLSYSSWANTESVTYCKIPHLWSQICHYHIQHLLDQIENHFLMFIYQYNL